MSTTVDSLPGGLSSVAQLHSISVDVAKSLTTESCWKNASLPTYAAIRKHALPPPTEPVTPPQLLTYTKRRARQQALRDARSRAKPHLKPGSIAPVISLTDLSTSTSSSSLRKTPSHSTDSSAESLSGLLHKRGRVTRRYLKRHFVLWGNTLYNYRGEMDDRPTWKLHLAGALVGVDAKNGRIVLVMGQKRLVLYVRRDKDLEKWAAGLARAADNASWGRKEEDLGDLVEEQSCAPPMNVEWDSFKSFSALKFRTTWEQDGVL